MLNRTYIVLLLVLIMSAGTLFSCCASKQDTIGPEWILYDKGTEFPVQYSSYGEFKNVGTENYEFIVKDREGLSKAVGEGIFPNEESIKKDPLYKKFKKESKLGANPWNHVWTDDPALDFFVWATTDEEEIGVRLFFVANALKEAGHLIHALKAFYAVIVHFPNAAHFTFDKAFLWYVAPMALDKIYSICRNHPELGVELQGAWLEMKNIASDSDKSNDIIKVNPGKFVSVSLHRKSKIDLSQQKVVEQRGKGKVRVVKYENGHWQLLVDDKPFIIKGINYEPTKIGESPHYGTKRSWMFVDDNNNGVIDAPYEAWVDENRNNRKDSNEQSIGDFALLKQMGCNTIRVFHVPENNQYNSEKEFNKPLLRDLYKKYGIRVVMGDFLGAYTIGSGAEWNKGTDYTDKEQCDRMKGIVREWVLDHKDEPYVLMWLLGNENNISGDYMGVNATRTNAAAKPKECAKFLGEVVTMIHKLDPNHPVAISNDDMIEFAEYYANYAPEIDIFAPSYYRDKDGPVSLWADIKKVFDRPVLINEYGSDVYNSISNQVDEDAQAQWHQGYWQAMSYNMPGEFGEGNCIGGIVFEWLDEWWKSHQGGPFTQEKTSDSTMPFPDMLSSEDWLGIISQGDGSDSPFLRQLRESYFVYKRLWSKK